MHIITYMYIFSFLFLFRNNEFIVKSNKTHFFWFKQYNPYSDAMHMHYIGKSVYRLHERTIMILVCWYIHVYAMYSSCCNVVEPGNLQITLETASVKEFIYKKKNQQKKFTNSHSLSPSLTHSLSFKKTKCLNLNPKN